MVSSQLEARGITDSKVLEAMRTVPRHAFVPDSLQDRAYDDAALTIGSGQTISQPYMVALMTEILALKDTDRVLEIGTGSGYQAAILSLLAHEVISIERHAPLAERARTTLAKLECNNVRVIVGDGTLGCPEFTPFDAIIVTAGGPKLPKALQQQLAMGGRLVCPVGPRKVQDLVRLVRTPDGVKKQRSIRCSFVPLIGDQGWGEDSV